MPVYPVLIVGDHAERVRFKVDIDYHRLPIAAAGGFVEADVAVAKRYALSTVRRRLHQQQFRLRVLDAYRERCAVCRFAHVELLDAAHIRPDAEVIGLAAIRGDRESACLWGES